MIPTAPKSLSFRINRFLGRAVAVWVVASLAWRVWVHVHGH